MVGWDRDRNLHGRCREVTVMGRFSVYIGLK